MDDDAGVGLKHELVSARNLLNAVNRASSAATYAWLLYLALAAFFVVGLAGVTHKDLLLNSPIALPVLQISIGLDGFFRFAPPLFILIHIGMMMQYVVLTKKLYAFLDVVRKEEQPAAAGEGAPSGGTHPLRYELNSDFFTQFLAGAPQSGIFTFMQQMIVWVTLIVLAAIVLLFFQVAALPYHDAGLTWAHRAYVLIDLGLVAVVGTFLQSPLPGFWSSVWFGWRTYPVLILASAAAFASIFAFSFLVATIPGERLDGILAAIGPSVEVAAPSGRPADRHTVFLPTAVIFESGIDAQSGRSASPFQRNLVVMDQDLVKDRDLTPGDVSLSLRYRDLRYARLDRSDLKQVDLTGADLTGASLEGADLTGARR